MCIAPIRVKNPWYFPPELREYLEKRNPYYFLHDTTSYMMYVPCGMCPECKQLNQLSFVQRAIEMGKFCYTLFGTLTYRNENLPVLKVGDYKLKFADVRDFVNFVKRVRKYNIIPPFRYLAVTEYGSDENKSHRPHFHFLIFIPYEYEFGCIDKYKGLEYAENLLKFIPSLRGWSRNLGDKYHPLYSPNSAFIRRGEKYTYDCHLVTGENGEDVVFYVTKYVLKFSEYVKSLQQALKLNYEPEEYHLIWRILRPKILTSNGMGVYTNFPLYPRFYEVDKQITEDVRSMIEHSILAKEETPYFYTNSDKYPLCKYFVERVMTMQQRVKFHNLKYGTPFDDESKTDIDIYQNNVSDFQKDLDKISKLQKIEIKLNRNNY